jgi:hypothetical protein
MTASSKEEQGGPPPGKFLRKGFFSSRRKRGLQTPPKKKEPGGGVKAKRTRARPRKHKGGPLRQAKEEVKRNDVNHPLLKIKALHRLGNKDEVYCLSFEPSKNKDGAKAPLTSLKEHRYGRHISLEKA